MVFFFKNSIHPLEDRIIDFLIDSWHHIRSKQMGRFFFPGSYQLFNYLQWMQMDRCCFFLTWKLSWTSHIIWVCLRIGYPQIPWFVIHLYTKWLFQPVAVRFLLSCCSECLWATLCLRNMHIYIIIHIYTRIYIYIYNYIYTHITHYIYIN